MSNEMTSSGPSSAGPDPVLAALQRLTPVQPQIDRDRLMFLAGRASMEEDSRSAYETASGTHERERGRQPVHGTQYPVPSTQYSVLSTELPQHSHNRRVGVSNKRYGQWLWPAAASVLAATSLALAAALALRPAAPSRFIVIRETPRAAVDSTIQAAALPDEVAINRNPATSQITIAASVPAENYLRTREVAFRMGLEALGSSSTAGRPAIPTYGELLLGIATSAGDPETSAARPVLPSNM